MSELVCIRWRILHVFSVAITELFDGCQSEVVIYDGTFVCKRRKTMPFRTCFVEDKLIGNTKQNKYNQRAPGPWGPTPPHT